MSSSLFSPNYEIVKADREQLEQFIKAIFAYASTGYVQFRQFFQHRDGVAGWHRDRGGWPSASIDDLNRVIGLATDVATCAGNNEEGVVFCPPVATFSVRDRATKAHMAEGVALSTDCDRSTDDRIARLINLLGRPTVRVASGGVWVDDQGGEHDKLHLHWRLTEPTRTPEDHRRLEEVRRLAAILVGADTSNVPSVHPLRWPGSWHRKGEPRLCRIVEINTGAEIELTHALERLREATGLEFGTEVVRSGDRTIERTVSSEALAKHPDDVAAVAVVMANEKVDWDYWNNTGMAFWNASAGAVYGLEAFHVWSAKSRAYNRATTDFRWDAISDCPPDKIGMGSLVYRARQADPTFDLPSMIMAQAQKDADARRAYEHAGKAQRGRPESIKVGAEWIAQMMTGPAEPQAAHYGPSPDEPPAANSSPPSDDGGDESQTSDEGTANADESVPPLQSSGEVQSKEESKVQSSRFRTRAEDKAAPPPVYLVAGLIEENTDVFLEAPKQHLKSFVALDLAYSIATGEKAFGILPVTNPGPVIYYCAEGYDDVIKRRAPAWEIAHNYEPYTIDDIIFANAAPFVNDPEGIVADIKYLEASFLKGRKARLIVVDTLNRALNGEDEDRASVASKYLNVVKAIRTRLGGSTLTVHHMGKDRERGGRGSSAFEAGMDTVMEIKHHKKNDDTGDHIIDLFVKFQKSGPDGTEYWMQSRPIRTDDGSSLVLDSIDETEALAEIKTADASKGNKLTAEQVGQFIREASGGYLTTSQLAQKIAERQQKKKESVVRALNRRKNSDFKAFILGDPADGRWALGEDAPLQDGPERREMH
jgi:hypothetical protein